MCFCVLGICWFDSGYIFTPVYEGVGDFTDFSVKVDSDPEVRGCWETTIFYEKVHSDPEVDHDLDEFLPFFCVKVDSHPEVVHHAWTNFTHFSVKVDSSILPELLG